MTILLVVIFIHKNNKQLGPYQDRIKDIRIINVTKKGLDDLLGLGNLEMYSSAFDKADVIFKGLRGATGVKEILMKKQKEMS